MRKYVIDLIQNQSEMFRYSYADIRQVLLDLGYEVRLFTAQNIENLTSELNNGLSDCVLFASNALNDKKISSVVSSKQFQDSLTKYLNTRGGRGCLILHQLKWAQDKRSLSFLPEDYRNATLIERPLVATPGENPKVGYASVGDLMMNDDLKNHQLMIYPDPISVKELKDHALGYKSLVGLYWHYLNNLDEDFWDTLVYDIGENKEKRPLLVMGRRRKDHLGRVIVCALPLDWQRQKRLLNNALTMAAKGTPYIAILEDEETPSVEGFNYFKEQMRVRRHLFDEYTVDLPQDQFDKLKLNIGSTHRFLIFGNSAELDNLREEVKKLVWSKVKEGVLKIIHISEDKTSHTFQFHVVGRERQVLRVLPQVEVGVQKELMESGVIDGSFWATIDSLQTIKKLYPRTSGSYGAFELRKSIEKARKHDRAGSYDEVFGVSIAYLWLQVNFGEQGDSNWERTLGWILNEIETHTGREVVLAYLTFKELASSHTGFVLPKNINIKERLNDLLESVDEKSLNESDLVVYLKGCLETENTSLTRKLVKLLKEKQDPDSGSWIDPATTASIVEVLLSIGHLLGSAGERHSLYGMIFSAILYIQDSMALTDRGEFLQYPWEGKASTSLKCILTWLKFDDEMEFPINELSVALESYIEDSRSVGIISSDVKAIETFKRMYQREIEENAKMKEDIEKLQKTKDKITIQVSSLSKSKRRYQDAFVVSVFAIYALMYVLIGSYIHVLTSYVSVLVSIPILAVAVLNWRKSFSGKNKEKEGE